MGSQPWSQGWLGPRPHLLACSTFIMLTWAGAELLGQVEKPSVLAIHPSGAYRLRFYDTHPYPPGDSSQFVLSATSHGVGAHSDQDVGVVRSVSSCRGSHSQRMTFVAKRLALLVGLR